MYYSEILSKEIQEWNGGERAESRNREKKGKRDALEINKVCGRTRRCGST